MGLLHAVLRGPTDQPKILFLSGYKQMNSRYQLAPSHLINAEVKKQRCDKYSIYHIWRSARVTKFHHNPAVRKADQFAMYLNLNTAIDITTLPSYRLFCPHRPLSRRQCPLLLVR